MSNELILAVDDSPTIRKIVEISLKRENFRVIVASSGLEALAAMADNVPDLILLDVQLPRMDGYQICSIMKKNERYKHIPVIMLSGKDGFFDRIRGRMVGATYYLTKPFDPNDLIKTVNKYIRR